MNRRMKVIYILHSTMSKAGSTKSFQIMVNGLRERDVDPVIVLPDTNGIYNSFVEQGYKVYVVNNRMHICPSVRRFLDVFLWLPRLIYWLYLNKTATQQLIRICAKEHPDIIHSNSSVVNFGYEAARRLGIPHVYHVREYGDLDFHYHYIPSRKTIIRRLGSKGNTSIFITNGIRKHFAQEDAQNAFVVYNPIITTATTTLRPVAKDSYLYVGRIQQGKGVELLVAAYSQYVQQSAHPLPLMLAGLRLDEQLCARLDKYIISNNLEQHVVFMGEIDDVSEAIDRAKAIVIPSENEAFGRVMPEAMARRCVVVARDTGGTHEQLDNGLAYTGQEIALRFTTESQLTGQLLTIDNAPTDQYSAMTDAAERTVRHLYTDVANVEAVRKIYQNITGQERQ